MCAFAFVPKAGAQCVSSARWDLCGGPPVRAVPTAIGVGKVDDLQDAPVAAAVSFVLFGVADLDGGPGQGVEGGEESGLVPLGDEDVVAAVFAQVAGVSALRVECVLCRPPDYAERRGEGAGQQGLRQVGGRHNPGW
jgi:hypothetical protein